MEDFSYLATIDSTVSQLSKLVTSTKLLSQKDEIPTLGSRILAGKFLEGMVVFGPVNPFNDFLTALERELISAIVIDKQELQCMWEASLIFVQFHFFLFFFFSLFS